MVRFEVEKCLSNIQYQCCDQRVHAFAWRVATVIHLRQDVQIIVCPICLCQKERSEKNKPNQGVLSCFFLNLILRTKRSKRSKRSKRIAFEPKNKRNLHSIHSLWCHRLPRQFWLSASSRFWPALVVTSEVTAWNCAKRKPPKHVLNQSLSFRMFFTCVTWWYLMWL